MKRLLMCVAGALLCVMTPPLALAQGKEVKGVVVDASGLPVIGATVMETGTTNGASTGLDGDYVLVVSSSDAVV